MIDSYHRVPRCGCGCSLNKINRHNIWLTGTTVSPAVHWSWRIDCVIFRRLLRIIVGSTVVHLLFLHYKSPPKRFRNSAHCGGSWGVVLWFRSYCGCNHIAKYCVTIFCLFSALFKNVWPYTWQHFNNNSVHYLLTIIIPMWLHHCSSSLHYNRMSISYHIVQHVNIDHDLNFIIRYCVTIFCLFSALFKSVWPYSWQHLTTILYIDIWLK